MGKELSARIQTSILNAAEKKALVWLAERQPRWVTSDLLTYVGVLGAVVCAVGCVLSNINVNYLWISSLGLVINWYGDSLDGTLARVRHTQRPLYGFFIDHTLDAITICIMCIGFGLSPAFRLDVTLLVLAGYLVLSIYTYICTILKDEFRLTYSSFGPTEFRLVVIILNTIYMYVPDSSNRYMVWGCDFGVFDFIGLAIAAFLFIIHLCQFAKDRKTLSMRDPLKPYHPEDKE